MAEIATTSWYRTGTVNVTSGSTKVTGSNTQFLSAGINPGASFRIDGLASTYEVAEVVSNTEITLARPYYGVTLSGQGYSIDRNAQSTLPATLSLRMADLIGKYERYINTDMHSITGESAYEIAKRLGKTTTATEALWIDELKNGAEYVALKEAISDFFSDGPAAHNAHYIRKNLGTFTEGISANIANGTYTGIYPGNYFDFSNVPYSYVDENGVTQSDTYSGRMTIAHCDYFRYCGDTDFRTRHVVVVPDSPLFDAPMNDTRTNTGGYIASKMKTVHLKRAEAIFKACFGEEHILKHRILVSSEMIDGDITQEEWIDSYVDLMNEPMVYGSYIFTSGTDGVSITKRHTESKTQLALFKYATSLITNRSHWWWLRDPVAAKYFAIMTGKGNAGYNVADHSNGVRPFALVG